AGEHEVKVEYQERGGAASVQFGWRTAPEATPIINTVTPSTAAPGGPAFTLVADGTDFAPGIVLYWNGEARPTAFVTSTRVTASIPASDIAIAGRAQIFVRNRDLNIS